ncbi:MAG: hypothetical protein D6698_03505, partial [Gammaproteobacteria bacterium]
GLATLFPEGGGYAGFLHGRVVDMFYFPIYEGYFPDWMPFWGGEYFQFFRPVFNVADASITIGVFSLLLFNRKFFSSHSIEDLQKQSAGEFAEESEIPTNEELATAPQSLAIEPNPDQDSAKES